MANNATLTLLSCRQPLLVLLTFQIVSNFGEQSRTPFIAIRLPAIHGNLALLTLIE